MKSSQAVPLIVSTALILGACGKQPAPSTSGATSESSTGQTASANLINAAIPKDAISTGLELSGHPVYSAADDTLHVRIQVLNRGKTNLVSAGMAMVRLGAMLIGPNGPDQPPGKRDFARIDLPMITPGGSAEVQANLPAAALINLPIRFDLVQEGINWFSAYGQPTLDIGPFKRCGDNEKSLCDVDNGPIPDK